MSQIANSDVFGSYFASTVQWVTQYAPQVTSNVLTKIRSGYPMSSYTVKQSLGCERTIWNGSKYVPNPACDSHSCPMFSHWNGTQCVLDPKIESSCPLCSQWDGSQCVPDPYCDPTQKANLKPSDS